MGDCVATQKKGDDEREKVKKLINNLRDVHFKNLDSRLNLLKKAKESDKEKLKLECEKDIAAIVEDLKLMKQISNYEYQIYVANPGLKLYEQRCAVAIEGFVNFAQRVRSS